MWRMDTKFASELDFKVRHLAWIPTFKFIILKSKEWGLGAKSEWNLRIHWSTEHAFKSSIEYPILNGIHLLCKYQLMTHNRACLWFTFCIKQDWSRKTLIRQFGTIFTSRHSSYQQPWSSWWFLSLFSTLTKEVFVEHITLTVYRL